MVSTEAESVQQDADCKKAMGREFKGTGDYADVATRRSTAFADYLQRGLTGPTPR